MFLLVVFLRRDENIYFILFILVFKFVKFIFYILVYLFWYSYIWCIYSYRIKYVFNNIIVFKSY